MSLRARSDPNWLGVFFLEHRQTGCDTFKTDFDLVSQSFSVKCSVIPAPKWRASCLIEE